MFTRFTRGFALFLLVSLVAAACSGGDDDGGDTSPSGTDGGNGEEVAPDEISGEVDRDGRFSKLDTFCEPAEGEDAAPEDVEAGISAEEIVITHVRVRLEELADIGFAVDVGDQQEQFQTFTDIINDRCGGIHGRQLRLELVEGPGLPGENAVADARRQCIEITEDLGSVFAMSVSGYGGYGAFQCLTTEHDTIFLTAASTTEETFAAADGKLIAVQPSPTASMRTMVSYLLDEGLLEGKTIAVVGQDSIGEPENVELGLIQPLTEAGIQVAHQATIGCGGGNVCSEGLAQAVQTIRSAGVDVVLPAMNVISFPGLMAEFVTQGTQPGDITFYNSNHHNQAGDLVSGKIVEFGGEEAAALYDGTVITDSAPTGDWRLPDAELIDFDEMCNREYAENNPSSTAYERDAENESKYGSVTTACSIMRILARTVEDAGPNPTRDDLVEAIKGLGGVDLQREVPGSLGPDKYSAPDEAYALEYSFPCKHGESVTGSCITPMGGAGFPIVRR